MSNSAGVSKKKKTEVDYPTDVPGLCSLFFVESELLIYFCYFVYSICLFMFIVACVCFHCPWILISARILVPLITLCSARKNQEVQGHGIGAWTLKKIWWRHKHFRYFDKYFLMSCQVRKVQKKIKGKKCRLPKNQNIGLNLYEELL